MLSLLLNKVRNKAFKRVLQSILYLPHFLSWVIIVGITFLLFSRTSGIVNIMLQSAGIGKIDFLTNPNLFWGLLNLQNSWKETGWGTVIFLAAIAAVDQGLHETAKIDGDGIIFL